MVNIGGRSKGCSNCRRRRIKCDENRPICLRCQRVGLICDGPKEFSFIEATIVPSRRRAEQQREAPPAASPVAVVAGPSTDRSLIRPSAPLLGNPHELYIMFTRKHIAPEGPVDTALQELLASDVARLAPTRTVDYRTTHFRAVLSFATIFFGTKHGSSDIVKDGYATYGAALKQLNRALSDPTCYLYDEIVVSVTTLALQEMLVPSGPKSYLNHILGLEKLLMLRDPTSHCSQSTVGLYKCLRHMMLYASLCAGQPSMLARQEWKTLLRQHCESEAELQEQYLYEALADCSVLNAELGDLLTNWESLGDDNDRIDRTRRAAQVLYGQLRTWRENRIVNPTRTFTDITPCWAPMRSLHTHPSNDPPPAPPDFAFADIHTSLMLMLYNATLLYVVNILITLPLEPQSQHSLDDYMHIAHLAVLEICRTLPDPTEETLHADMHASPMVHWAVQVAYMILQNDLSVQGRWLTDFLNQKGAATHREPLWRNKSVLPR